MSLVDKVNNELAIYWIEDQPTIRLVKGWFIASGVVAVLVGELKGSDKDSLTRGMRFDGSLDGKRVVGTYWCEVYRNKTLSEADAALRIKMGERGAVYASNATGEIYEAPFPECVTDCLNQ